MVFLELWLMTKGPLSVKKLGNNILHIQKTCNKFKPYSADSANYHCSNKLGPYFKLLYTDKARGENTGSGYKSRDVRHRTTTQTTASTPVCLLLRMS